MIRTFAFLVALLTTGAVFADRPPATVYKSPDCGCCSYYVEYLREAGFAVEAVNTRDLESIKHRHGVPGRYRSCHTTVVGGYVVEGHVPISVLDRMLAERPSITGITLPGMPTGSPGMPGVKRKPFEIYQFVDGESGVSLYAEH